jgi:glycosyltransferase involved in cell wall biosynthesis
VQKLKEDGSMRLGAEPSVVIITASVGRAALRRCADSVQQQDYPNVRHLVVVDGPDFSSGAAQALKDVSDRGRLETLVLPRNTGHSSHFGYRIYGAMPLLVDDDIVCYLDEDNWLDPDHVSSALHALRDTDASWAFSLRKICTPDGEIICEDDSDSLGYWPKFATLLPEHYLSPQELEFHTRYPNLVDSSCYILPRQLACSVASLWQELLADSVVPTYLVQHYPGVCSGRSTVNYALGGDTGIPADWFTYGNHGVRKLHGPGALPWRDRPRKLAPGIIRHATPDRRD